MAGGLTRGASKALTQLLKKMLSDSKKTGKNLKLLDELDLLPVAEDKGSSKIIPEFEWRAEPGYEIARDELGNILKPDLFGKVIKKIPTEKSKVGIMTPSTRISRKVINFLLKENPEVGKDFLKLKTQNLVKGKDNFIQDGSLRLDTIKELLNEPSIKNSSRMTGFLKTFVEKGDKAAKKRSKLSEVLFSKDMNLFERSLDDPLLLLSDDMKKFVDPKSLEIKPPASLATQQARRAASITDEQKQLQQYLNQLEKQAAEGDKTAISLLDDYKSGIHDPTTMRLGDIVKKRGQREYAKDVDLYGSEFNPGSRPEYDEAIDLWRRPGVLGKGKLAKTYENIPTSETPMTEARTYPEFSTDIFGKGTSIPSEAIGIGGIRRPKDITLSPEQWRGTPETKKLLEEVKAKDLQRDIAEARMMDEGFPPRDHNQPPLDPTQEQSVLKAENILRQKKFEQQLIRDAERGGAGRTQFSEVERSASGKPFGLEEHGPMPWDVITPDEVSRLSATELRAFKRNMEEFDYLLESYLKQGYPPKQAFRLAKQEMQGQVASSADAANIMMKQSGIITDEGLPSHQLEDLGRTRGLADEVEEGPMAEQLRQYFDDIDTTPEEFKKGGRVKAKKKKKTLIPKILQKRNIKGKRKAQRAVGAGAALRGWGAVRRVS